VFTRFGFEDQIQCLDEANALYLVLQRFVAIDLSPAHVSNTEMGTVFEELIRKFAEASNETAGEHFTPREVIALMVDLLLSAKRTRPARRTSSAPSTTRRPAPAARCRRWTSTCASRTPQRAWRWAARR